MHAATPSSPMIHISDSCGLKSDPAGVSAILCPVLLSKTDLGRAGCAVASSVAATPCPLIKFVSTPVMISLLPRCCRSVLAMRSSWYFDRLQHRVNYLANRDAFHLELRPQQHAVLKYSSSQ